MTTQPQQADQPKPAEYCSFCGAHRDEVPLMITSQLSPKVGCCSNCAMTMVHQTFQWAGGIFKTVVENEQRMKRSAEAIRRGDPTEQAIERAARQS